MSNRFIDNVTPLDASTLNKFEDDLKAFAEKTVQTNESAPASQTKLGGVKIWLDGSVLNISTE